MTKQGKAREFLISVIHIRKEKGRDYESEVVGYPDGVYPMDAVGETIPVKNTIRVIEHSAYQQAQAEIAELKSEVDRLTLNCKGLVSDHHRNLKEIAELTANLEIAVEAFERIIKKSSDESDIILSEEALAKIKGEK